MKLNLAVLTCIMCTIAACSKDKIARYDTFEKLTNSLESNELIAWFVDIPSGTQVTHGNNKIHVTLPQSVEAMYFSDKNDRFEPIASADYTCTCETKDGTCKPFVAGDKIGCTTERNQTCTQCVGKKTSFTGLPTYSTVYYVHKIDKSDMGLLDGFAPIQLISDPNLLRTLPPVTPELLENQKINKALDEILTNFPSSAHTNFSGANLPIGYSLIAIGIDDHVAYLAIPKNKVEAGMIEIAPIMRHSEEGISCSGCNGKCTLKTAKLGQIKYCDGCDSGCTIRGY